MVVFPPICPPKVLSAYSNVPLRSNITSIVQREFKVGAFARFPGPLLALTIHERPDFYEQSSLAIREALDREGQTGAFILIDNNTTKPGSARRGEPFTTAVWWVTSRAQSERLTQAYTHFLNPPITYPREAFVLWRARLLTQDLPVQWLNWASKYGPDTNIAQTHPYDPHDFQPNAFSLGLDFSNKNEAQGFCFGPTVQANYSEIEISQDPVQLRRFLPRPLCVIRLTPQAATEAGLVSSWRGSYREIPQPGDVVKLTQYWDWDSPKWAGNGTANPRFLKVRRRQNIGPGATAQSGLNASVDHDPGKFLQNCQQHEVVNDVQIDRLLPSPLQSIATS